MWRPSAADSSNRKKKTPFFQTVVAVVVAGLVLERAFYYNRLMDATMAQIVGDMASAVIPTSEHDASRMVLSGGGNVLSKEQSNHFSNSPKEQQQARRGLSNAALQQWCPFATCHVTDLCHPCKRRYLIVITTGRSASTTLQNMLHSLPGVRMAGENNGMLHEMHRAIAAVRDRKEWSNANFPRDEQRSLRGPWAHDYTPPSAFACVVQQMAEVINPPPNINGTFAKADSWEEDDRHAVIGFKTIRFPNLGSMTGTGTNPHRRLSEEEEEEEEVADDKERRSKSPLALGHQRPRLSSRRNKNKSGPFQSRARLEQLRKQLKTQQQSTNEEESEEEKEAPKDANSEAQRNEQEEEEEERDVERRLQKEAQFVKDMFPCSKIIVNLRLDVRDHASSIKNLWSRKKSIRRVEHELTTRNQRLMRLRELLEQDSPGRTLLLDSSTWTQNVTILNDMISSWLGFDKACHFEKLFEFNTHPKFAYGHGDYRKRENPEGCQALLAAN